MNESSPFPASVPTSGIWHKNICSMLSPPWKSLPVEPHLGGAAQKLTAIKPAIDENCTNFSVVVHPANARKKIKPPTVSARLMRVSIAVKAS